MKNANLKNFSLILIGLLCHNLGLPAYFIYIYIYIYIYIIKTCNIYLHVHIHKIYVIPSRDHVWIVMTQKTK
jgi:hypothetical protein